MALHLQRKQSFCCGEPALMSKQAKLAASYNIRNQSTPVLEPQLTYDQTLAARLPANLHNRMEQLPVTRFTDRHGHGPSWKHPFH